MKGRVFFGVLLILAALLLVGCQREIPRSGEYPIEATVKLEGEWKSPLRVQMEIWGGESAYYYTYALFGESVSPVGEWKLFRVVPAGRYRVHFWAARGESLPGVILAKSGYFDVWVPPAKNLEITLER